LGGKWQSALFPSAQATGPYVDPTDLARRVGLARQQFESLATAGALGDWGEGRRETLWQAGHLAMEHPQYLPHTNPPVSTPLFDRMTPYDTMVADRVFTGVSPGDHPLRYFRSWLSQQGVWSVSDTTRIEPGRRIWVAGIVTHRQRPATARGVTFLNIEDETGLVNVICGVGFWRRYRSTLRENSALIIRGILERSPEGVVSVVADGAEGLPLGVPEASRDFR
jgi:error-prone DNA polymerase